MHDGRQTRILVVDDQPLFRTAIATLIEEQEDLTVIGEADNGLVAVEKAHELPVDLVVMDVEMPVMNGLEATRLIREELPGVKVVMLTVSLDTEHLFEAIHHGAHGYLLKDLRPEQLYDMIRSVMRDQTPISPSVAGPLLAEIRRGACGRSMMPAPRQEEPVLTRRELEIMRLVAQGLSNKQIAHRLVITEGTVKNHVHNALEKLHLSNRIQAAAYIVRQGKGGPISPS
jgi:two-component system nitrate/nitrite response regulator NarL